MNASPRMAWLHAIVIAATSLVAAAPAVADITDPSINCSVSDAADKGLNKSYLTCSENYADGFQEAPKGTISPFKGYESYGAFDYVGQTTMFDGPSGKGPFEPFGRGLYFGTLTLTTPQTAPFAIALGANGDYSLYLYDPSKVLGGSVSSIDISTLGTTGVTGSFELEYANLYAPVPEPASCALMLAGLAATGLALRRRIA